MSTRPPRADCAPKRCSADWIAPRPSIYTCIHSAASRLLPSLRQLMFLQTLGPPFLDFLQFGEEFVDRLWLNREVDVLEDAWPRTSVFGWVVGLIEQAQFAVDQLIDVTGGPPSKPSRPSRSRARNIPTEVPATSAGRPPGRRSAGAGPVAPASGGAEESCGSSRVRVCS